MGWSKGNREHVERIEKAILAARRRGVCDLDGHSVKINGVYVAKPRSLGVIRFHKTYPRYSDGNL